MIEAERRAGVSRFTAQAFGGQRLTVARRQVIGVTFPAGGLLIVALRA
jgi:hypothetical protein